MNTLYQEITRRWPWIGQSIEGWKLLWVSMSDMRSAAVVSALAWLQLECKRLWELVKPGSFARMPGILWVLLCIALAQVRGFSPLITLGNGSWWTIFITLVSLGWACLFIGFLQAKASYPVPWLKEPIGGNKSLGMYVFGALVWVIFGLVGCWFPLWVVLGFLQFVPLFVGTSLQNQSMTFGYLAVNSLLALAGWWYVIAG